VPKLELQLDRGLRVLRACDSYQGGNAGNRAAARSYRGRRGGERLRAHPGRAPAELAGELSARAGRLKKASMEGVI
jgi:hypothetical protein